MSCRPCFLIERKAIRNKASQAEKLEKSTQADKESSINQLGYLAKENCKGKSKKI